jgi:hypothetical protein
MKEYCGKMRMRMTLDEFIAIPAASPFFQDRAWVTEPGFRALYVRKGSRYIGGVGIEGRRYNHVFELASIDAENPGEGAFKKLLEKLELVWKGPIFIESVLSVRFGSALLRMGFVPVYPNDNGIGNFVKGLNENHQ